MLSKLRAGVLMVLWTSGQIVAGELEAVSPPQFSMETSVVSRYLWRGTVVNSSPSLQPSMTLSYHGASVNLWSNVSTTPQRDQAWTESDVTLEYGRRLGRWNVAGGLIEYRFVDTSADEGNHTTELYVGCTLEGPLSPSIRAFHDIGTGDGNYYSGSITKAFRLRGGMQGLTTLGIGLNQHQYQRQTTISNVESTTSIEVFSNERLVIAPFVTVMSGHRTLFGTHAMVGLRALLKR